MRRVEEGYLVHCPGCDEPHIVACYKPLANGAKWSFDGNEESPTFSPSLLVRTGRAIDPSYKPDEDDPPQVCHSFIRNGNWEFLGDCTHVLAGKTVPIPAWPD